MHFHPYLQESELHKIRVWQESSAIVAVAHFESRLGQAFFQVHPEFTHLKSEMLQYAGNHLCAELDNGRRYLRAFINDFDAEFESIAEAQGYKKDTNNPEPTSQFVIPSLFPSIDIPDGFHLKSLQDDNNLHKVNRVLHRGFNHPGEPPEEHIEGRRKMQSAPNFRKDLTIVVEAPDGDFVSFCGMWLDAVNRIAYVEPVATDPSYRFMGLGKAVVLEGIRRCAGLGATVAFVGSGQTFYEAIGFKKLCAQYPWIKYS
jgi:predicted N-acetyltransferase YhbS